MQLFSKLFHEKLSSLLSFVQFGFRFIKSVLEFGNFFDADSLHFFIVLLQGLEISLFGSHFSLVILLEILTSLHNEYLLRLVFLLINFQLLINFLLKNLILLQQIFSFLLQILLSLFLLSPSCKIFLSKILMSLFQIFILQIHLIDDLSFLTEFLFLLIFCFLNQLLKFAFELLHCFELRVMILLNFNNLSFQKLLLGYFLSLGLVRARLRVPMIDNVIFFVLFL